MQEADHRYRNCDGYAQWAENTPVFIPGVLGGRGWWMDIDLFDGK